MFVDCSHCVFLCILLGCLTHKLWLSNCVSMKRSYSVCFTAAHLLCACAPYWVEGFGSHYSSGNHFRAWHFVLEHLLYFGGNRHQIFLQSVSRDSAAGILWVVEQQGSFLRRECTKQGVWVLSMAVFFSIFIYNFFLIAFGFPSPSEIGWFRNLMSLKITWFRNLMSEGSVGHESFWVFLFCSFLLRFSFFFLYFVLFFCFWVSWCHCKEWMQEFSFFWVPGFLLKLFMMGVS